MLRNYSDIFRTLCNFGIFKTLVYSEPKPYSKSCQISSLECFARIVNGFNYFRNISFSGSLLYKRNIMNSFNTGLIFSPEVFIPCKKVSKPREPGVVNFDMPVSILVSILVYILVSRFCITFLKRMIRQIENENRSVEKLLFFSILNIYKFKHKYGILLCL